MSSVAVGARGVALAWFLATCCHAETYVLSAGVEQHDDGRISSLKYAVADARSIAALFRASGVRPENVTVLTSSEKTATRRPTRIALIANLQRIRDRARAGDKVVFFFAGHGIEENGVQYLLTVDTRRDLVAETALPLDLVNKALEGLQAGELLCIIDACRNNPDAARGDEGAQLTEGLVRGVRPRRLPGAAEAPAMLVATLLSCDVGQRAYEDPERGHGVFTVQLLGALTGGAKGRDGVVHLSDLSNYVQREVALWSRRTGREQTPRLVNPSGGDMEILRPGEEPLVSIDARNSTLADVVADIAEQVGAQVVFGPGADPEAKVSGHLELQPLTTALKVLLLAHRLTVRRQGTMYIIEAPGAVPEPERPVPTPAPPSIKPELREGVPYNGPKPTNWPAYLPWPIPGVSNPELRFRVAEQDGMPQVLIPAGEFLMGSSAAQQAAACAQAKAEQANDVNEVWFRAEGPPRKVYLSAFWMDLHEVTVAQYQRFCQATGRSMDTSWRKFNHGPQNPVVDVTWGEAAAYAQWAGRPLPTEAQWEKAARGGTTTAYPWGDAWEARKVSHLEHGNGTTPMGSYPPNGFGLFDMIGNASEWCRDWFHADWYARMPSRDPVNDTAATMRVLRGGSWNYKPVVLRVADRDRLSPLRRSGSCGFRCVSPAD